MTPATELPLPKLSEKKVLKVNAYDQGGTGNVNLLPMFPYWGPGDIVPCTAIHESDGTPRSIGYFIHTNSVDELVLNLAGDGQLRTGELYVGHRRHGVGGAGGTPFFAVQVIAQRQLESGDQPESVAFECTECNAEIYRYDFGTDGYAERVAPLSPTAMGTMEAMQAWNADEQIRTCGQCGHVNAEFPLAVWGFANHVRAMRIAERGRKVIAAYEAGAETRQ